MKWYEIQANIFFKAAHKYKHIHTYRSIHSCWLYEKAKKTLLKVILHSDEFGINNIKTQIILSNKRKSVGKGKLRERWNIFPKKAHIYGISASKNGEKSCTFKCLGICTNRILCNLHFICLEIFFNSTKVMRERKKNTW